MDVVTAWLDAYSISLLNGVARGLLLFMMAVGLSLIFGLMDVLNLAHGAVFLVGGYMAVTLSSLLGLPFGLAVPAAIAVGLLLGGLFAYAVRPLGSRGHLDQALLTLGLAFVLSDLASIIWGNDVWRPAAPELLGGGVSVMGSTYPVYRLAVIVVGLCVVAAVYLVVERTQVGALVRAAVVDRQMVSALGVNVNRVLIGMFAAGSALAAFGGVVGAPVLGVRPGLDWETLILALVVIVIGGLGSIPGAFVGALIIGQVESLGVALMPQLGPFLLFGAMAVVLLVRPSGLFGDATLST